MVFCTIVLLQRIEARGCGRGELERRLTTTGLVTELLARIALANFHCPQQLTNTPLRILRSPTTTTTPFTTPEIMADALKDSPIKAVQVEALVRSPARAFFVAPPAPLTLSRRL